MRIYRNDDSRPFFEEQRERLRRQLDESLAALQAAKNEMGLADVDQRRTTLEEQFNAVELDRLNTERQMATSQSRIVDLKRQMEKVPERLVASKRTVPNQGADLLRDQLYALQVKAMDLKARYSDSHPLVQAVNQQLNDAKAVLAQQSDQRMETTDDVNPIHRELSLELKREEAVLAGCAGRLAELDQQKAAVLADLRLVNSHEVRIDQLTRQADLARGNFFQYSENMEEARIDKELENDRISNVSIVQPATLAEKPVKPSKVLIALSTMLMAVAGTGGLVLVSEQLHTGSGDHDVYHNGAAARASSTLGRRHVHRRGPAVKANGRANGKVVTESEA
jgi:uncharacterized protein involved in exopolysaccharide biosynthesis